MSFRKFRDEDRRIKQRIYDILKYKIKDPLYKGRGKDSMPIAKQPKIKKDEYECIYDGDSEDVYYVNNERKGGLKSKRKKKPSRDEKKEKEYMEEEAKMAREARTKDRLRLHKRDDHQRGYSMKLSELLRAKKQIDDDIMDVFKILLESSRDECPLIPKSRMEMDILMEKKRKPKSVRRVKAGVISAKGNDWIRFYKRWLKDNKHLGGSKGMKLASMEYQNMKNKKIRY